MRDFLLDTQTIRYWYDKDCPQNAAVMDNIESLKKQVKSLEHQPKLLVSVVTLGEIEFGHCVQLENHAIQQEAYLKFVRDQLPVTLELTEDAVAGYGKLRSRLFNKYAPGEKRNPKMRPEQLIDPVNSLALQIQENDLWIAAQGVAHGMVLVTNDKMHAIRKVSVGMDPPLLMQNWTKVGAAKLDSGPIANSS